MIFWKAAMVKWICIFPRQNEHSVPIIDLHNLSYFGKPAWIINRKSFSFEMFVPATFTCRINNTCQKYWPRVIIQHSNIDSHVWVAQVRRTKAADQLVKTSTFLSCVICGYFPLFLLPVYSFRSISFSFRLFFLSSTTPPSSLPLSSFNFLYLQGFPKLVINYICIHAHLMIYAIKNTTIHFLILHNFKFRFDFSLLLNN